MSQRFTTTDVLRLEVRNDPGPGHLRNYIPNPNGDLGGWGWVSPVENSRVRPDLSVGLLFETMAAQSGVYFATDLIPVRFGATHIRATLRRNYGTANVGARGRLEFYDADGALLSSSAQTALLDTDLEFGDTGGLALPAGTATVRLRVDLYRAGGTALDALDSVVLDALQLIMGTLAEVAPTPPAMVILEEGWTNILGDAADLVVDRSELDLGVLTATCYSADLDPAVADTLRKGKAIRLLYGGGDEPLFLGEVRNATVAYDLANPDPNKRAKIALEAVDAVATLANNPRPNGVSAIAELPHVLEGAGVPWNVNGDTGHTATTPAIVATNPNASAVDQIAITRDTALGYAWVSRTGVLNAYDAALLPDATGIGTAVLDETVYTDVVVDYDLDRCINVVRLKVLRLDPATGETQEVDYGPYVDLASRNEYGAHEATFTVQGLDEDPATLAGYAEAILAANATPRRRLQSATLTLDTLEALDDWATLDLYDARIVVNANADLLETARVVGLTHRITARAGGGSSWRLEARFAGEDNVAQPTAVPSPPATSVLTLAQLLRPVGEVTGFMGLPSMVWPGWLLLNGQALTPGAYPELEAWLAEAGLATNVVPNLTDRIPVGAGVKALGAKTGGWAKTLTVAQLPAHDHAAGTLTVDSSNAAGTSGARVARGTATSAGAIAAGMAGTTGNRGNGDPVDITPPVFGLYWIIRARSGA